MTTRRRKSTFVSPADLVRIGAVTCVALALAGCESTTGPGVAAEYDLLFVSHEPIVEGVKTGQDIYRMRPGISARENLTRLSTVEYPTFSFAVRYGGLALSPDGRTMAFTGYREGCPGIWAMATDGSNLRKLSIGEYATTRCNYSPRWSPDGRQVAFTSSRDGSWSIYVADADGHNARNVSSSIDARSGFKLAAPWSPDGRVIFQYSAGEGRVEAYSVNPNGTVLTRLFGRVDDHSPHWSPDRSRVAFIRYANRQANLFVMKSDGSQVTRLTSHTGLDGMGYMNIHENAVTNWSADGRKIAFVNYHWGVPGSRLYVINVDGTGLVELARDAEFDGWTPDGRVTFTAPSPERTDIFTIKADGTDLVNLTNTPDLSESNGTWVRR